MGDFFDFPSRDEARNFASGINKKLDMPIRFKKIEGVGGKTPILENFRGYTAYICCVLGAPAGGPSEFDTAPASHKASFLSRQFAFAMHASFA